VQYYYRYLCFFQLGDYQKAERDTARNLRLFDFVKTYAGEEKYIEDFEQYRPYVMMMNTRAKVLGALKSKKVNQVVSEIHSGINQIERVYEHTQNSEIPKTEIAFLKNWADEIIKRYSSSKKQRLMEELEKAVINEEFERAAKIRDRLNRMKE
jgi:excinuclease UvrABC nuclease subunit